MAKETNVLVCQSAELNKGQQASIFDVAKYILERQGELSIWKLQKLCYYAQAWSLAWTEQAMFPEEFEAWKNGPVCPELLRESKEMFYVRFEDCVKGNPENLTAEQVDTIDVVLESYGDKDAYWLREQAHREPPWRDARGDLSEGASCSSIISKEAMEYYYGGL